MQMQRESDPTINEIVAEAGLDNEVAIYRRKTVSILEERTGLIGLDEFVRLGRESQMRSAA